MINKKQILIILLVLCALAVGTVSAQTITFANPNGLAQRDFMIYNTTGQMVAFVNSTSVVTVDGAEDIIIMMKPVQTNLLEDPLDWVSNNMIPFVQSNATVLVFVAIVVGLAITRRK